MPQATPAMLEAAEAAFLAAFPHSVGRSRALSASVKAAVEAALALSVCNTPGGCRDPQSCYCGAWGPDSELLANGRWLEGGE